MRQFILIFVLFFSPHLLAQEAGLPTEITMVSVDPEGRPLFWGSFRPSINANGRFVAFESNAHDFAEGTRQGFRHIYVHDRQTGQITYVSFASDERQLIQDSYQPSISASGRFVAFASSNRRLSGDWTLDIEEYVFVHDRETGQTTRASVTQDRDEGIGWSLSPSISADGRLIAFTSNKDLVGRADGRAGIFVHDRETAQTSLVSSSRDFRYEWCVSPSISLDGRFVAFSCPLSLTLLERASGASPGPNNIFVRDRETGQTTRISLASDQSDGDGSSLRPSISTEARFVAFESRATNLIDGDTNGTFDIFVYERATGRTIRVSVASDGSEGNGESRNASISADGQFVTFESAATNLVEAGGSRSHEIFVVGNPFYNSSENLIMNPGFEQKTIGWSGFENSIASVTIGDGSVHDGRYSAQLRSERYASGNIISDPVLVVGEKTYLISSWVKLINVRDEFGLYAGSRTTGVGITVYWYDISGNLIKRSEMVSGLKGSRDWMEIGRKLIAPRESFSARVYFNFNKVSGMALFDNVKMMRND